MTSRIKFFAINKEKDLDHRNHIKQLAKTLGVPIFFFKEVDGSYINALDTEIPHVKLLSYDHFVWLHNTKEINKFHCQPPNCDILGATASHFSLYNKLLLDDDSDSYCIFEDNVCLLDQRDTTKLIKVLYALKDESFDLCLLFEPCFCTSKNREKYTEDIDIVDSVGFGGVFAYIITKRGAGKMVATQQYCLNKTAGDHLSDACYIDNFLRTFISPIFGQNDLLRDGSSLYQLSQKPFSSRVYKSKEDLCKNFEPKNIALELSMLKSQNSYTRFRSELTTLRDKFSFENVIHVIWVKGHRTYSIIQYLTVRAAVDTQPNHKVFIYNDEEPIGNEWWEKTKDYATIIHIDPPKFINGKNIPYAQHIADIMRICILYEFGGIYIDSDLLLIKSLDMFLNQDEEGSNAIMCVETDNKVWNGLIITAPRNCFLERWIKEYETKYGDEIGGCWWAGLSVETPMRLYKEDNTGITLLNTHTFLPFGIYDDTIYHKEWYEGVYDSSYGLHLWETEAEKRGVLPKNIEWFSQHPTSIFSKFFGKYIEM